MTIKEVNEMRMKGMNTYGKEKLFDAYAITHATKKSLADIEKEITDALESQMTVGDQMSLELGDTTYTVSKVELDEIDFDCDESVLHSECLKAGQTLYLKAGVNTTAIKKDYKNGSLHPDIVKHIKINKQIKMKYPTPKKAKKEEE